MRIARFGFALLIALVTAIAAASPARRILSATKPTTEPTGKSGVTAKKAPVPPLKPAAQVTVKEAVKAEVSPEASTVLQAMKDAYGKLKSLEQTGTITGTFDVAGQQLKMEQKFSSSFAAPNKFRHETIGGLLIVSTGQNVYLYSPEGNKYAADEAKERGAMSDLPEGVGSLLQLDNPSIDPSLMLAIVSDLGEELGKQATSISKATDATIGEQTYTCLKLELANGSSARMLVDQQTHLLRQFTADYAAVAAKRLAPNAKTALVTVDYTTITPNASLKDELFAWTPPADSLQVMASASPWEHSAGEAKKGNPPPRKPQDKPGPSEVNLEGKPAPDFELKDVAGESVKLADLKGKVVVLDFWATWCQPCIASLPKLNAIASDNELVAKGMTVLAINEKEAAIQVKSFMESNNLSLRSLLDETGAIAGKYLIKSIPQTVVIDKNGIIRKVLIGTGADTEKMLRAAINEALKAE